MSQTLLRNLSDEAYTAIRRHAEIWNIACALDRLAPWSSSIAVAAHGQMTRAQRTEGRKSRRERSSATLERSTSLCTGVDNEHRCRPRQ